MVAAVAVPVVEEEAAAVAENAGAVVIAEISAKAKEVQDLLKQEAEDDQNLPLKVVITSHPEKEAAEKRILKVQLTGENPDVHR